MKILGKIPVTWGTGALLTMAVVGGATGAVVATSGTSPAPKVAIVQRADASTPTTRFYNAVEDTTSSSSLGNLSAGPDIPVLSVTPGASGKIILRAWALVIAGSTSGGAYVGWALNGVAQGNYLIQCGASTYASLSGSFVATGLTPGTTYTVNMLYASGTSGQTVTFGSRVLEVSNY